MRNLSVYIPIGIQSKGLEVNESRRRQERSNSMVGTSVDRIFVFVACRTTEKTGPVTIDHKTNSPALHVSPKIVQFEFLFADLRFDNYR